MQLWHQFFNQLFYATLAPVLQLPSSTPIMPCGQPRTQISISCFTLIKTFLYPFMSLHEIKLAPTEEKIITKIKTYAHTLQGIVPRVAGGWVRDKLLGKVSNDIDITINRISGYAFAHGMQEYYGITGSIGQIKANPDKSKHLETAVMRIEGVFVDFLSLRTEEYFDTRIPVVKSCSAQEDAFRRDLTINALFYNIMEQCIEDFTGRGLSDLEHGVIRTPMDPLKTLIDDPLRILRIIRFSVRFKFKIADGLFVAFQNEHVRTNLHKKISNERIGQEMYKILGYEHFIHAFRVMVGCALVPAIFKRRIPIDQHDLMHVYRNYVRLQRYFVFDERLARLYIMLLHNACVSVENTFSNFLIVKNCLCYGKREFGKVKVVEKNLCLLRKVNERMSAEDAVFLVRHMKEEYELSFFVYLMVADYGDDEVLCSYEGVVGMHGGDEKGISEEGNEEQRNEEQRNEEQRNEEQRNEEQRNEEQGNEEITLSTRKNRLESEKSMKRKQSTKKDMNEMQYDQQYERCEERVMHEENAAEKMLTHERVHNITMEEHERTGGSLTREMEHLHIHEDTNTTLMSDKQGNSQEASSASTNDKLNRPSTGTNTVHESLRQYANANKHLILHILRTIRPYKKLLFTKTFTFNGRTIFDSLGIDQNEISFYLEMAKVQQIVHGVADGDIMDRLKVIKEQQRIKGFRTFYLTNIF
ncbi:hypothetical protein VCUG_00929 [Vavraia culicis subsp. floridensis]|uniref:Poly A polymerase head domain-containing protein n=1 Tax=Vavraia culicis (isolate floridensis) TaxID=948595 RepID=L2GVB1_VAVCU|nr:uncharacterized protein VCUG_00929 [Vavraia culicis subsp. floridensis]ELA47606.2 hypothetical protein VCUG_00929 [Vavraia culicis subsp. floridensis]